MKKTAKLILALSLALGIALTPGNIKKDSEPLLADPRGGGVGLVELTKNGLVVVDTGSFEQMTSDPGGGRVGKGV
jgi:hypothetical protein